MTPFLVDEWLFETWQDGTDGDQQAREAALQLIVAAIRERPIQPLPFLSRRFVQEFRTDYRNYRVADAGALARILSAFEVAEQLPAARARIRSTPIPQLSSNWLRALAKYSGSDSSPEWRDPMIFIPEARATAWSSDPEVSYEIEGQGDYRRNLVRIQKRGEHPYFDPDLDPWRLGTLDQRTEGRAVRERRAGLRRLPRPLHLLPPELPCDDLLRRLQGHLEWSCGRPGAAFYIPPRDWDPRRIPKLHWRNGSVFPTRVAGGGRSGPVDREQRIWIWDPGENTHWDVQLPNGEHRNVSHEGRVL